MGVACVACVVVVVVALAGGCPDPCTWFGGGCNLNSDCPRGEVCRIARTFESSQCAVVKGTCVELQEDVDGVIAEGARLCGSVADCNEGECCDPDTNQCVSDVGYDTTIGCDALTCRDCRNTALGLRCAVKDRKSCAPGQVCASVLTDIKGVERGVCRQECTSNVDCANIAECVNGGAGTFCGAPDGTPCISVDDDSGNNDRACLASTCVDIDADGDTVAPYCAIACDEETSACPAGFTCDAQQTGDCLRH